MKRIKSFLNISNMENEVKNQLAQSHHIHIPRGYDNRKTNDLMQIIEHEALDQLEP